MSRDGYDMWTMPLGKRKTSFSYFFLFSTYQMTLYAIFGGKPTRKKLTKRMVKICTYTHHAVSIGTSHTVIWNRPKVIYPVSCKYHDIGRWQAAITRLLQSLSQALKAKWATQLPAYEAFTKREKNREDPLAYEASKQLSRQVKSVSPD